MAQVHPKWMTHATKQPQARAQLTSTAQLHGTLQHLLKAAIQRQIWLLFLDNSARLIDPIMPMNDHPRDPFELHQIEDLGRVTFPEVFTHRAREIAKIIGATSFVVVWERPGSEELTATDSSWGDAIARSAATCDPGAAQLRAMFLMHDEGVTLISDFKPDSELDYE